MLPTPHESSVFEKGVYVLIGVLVFVLPILFIPGAPFFFTKTFGITLLVLAGLLLLITSQLKARSVSFPNHPALFALWLVPLAYLLSSIFSSNMRTSLFGQSLGVDTFFYILIAAILTTLVVVVVKTQKRALYLYAALFASAAVLTLFHLVRLFAGSDVLSFGIFTTASATPVGNWNDLAVLFGLFVVVSIITLLSRALRGAATIAISGLLVVSLFFLALINFSIVWWIIAFVSLSTFVYSVISGNNSTPQQTIGYETEAQKDGGISFVSLALLAVSLAFIFFGSSLGGYLSSNFNVAPFNVRPSWESTIEVGKQTYADTPLFGSGANTFSKQWLLYKPSEVNQTVFWNVRFNSGIGFIPTSLITTGLIGLIAWVMFFLFFGLSGVRTFVRRQEQQDRLSRYIAFSSFVAATYLWVLALLYTPSVVILTLTFVFTGIFLAALRHASSGLREFSISFVENPRLGFIAVLVLTVVFLGSIGTLFNIGEKYIAAVNVTKAQAFIADGDFTSALERANTATELDQNDANYRFASEVARQQLEALLSQGGQATEEQRVQFQNLVGVAVQNAQSAVRIDDTNDANWVALARVYQILVPVQVDGAYENASRAYNEALVFNPRSPSIRLEQARLELTASDPDAAAQFIQTALEQKANYTEARFLLAQIQLSEGNVNQAIGSVENIALLNPNNPVVFFQLGILYYGVNNYQTSIQALERAIALDRDYSNARYFLGLSYYRVGRTQDAIAQFEVIRELNPGNEEVIQILSNLENGKAPLPGVSPISGFEKPPLGGE